MKTSSNGKAVSFLKWKPSAESRKTKRALQNKLSAKAHRQRKKDTLISLRQDIAVSDEVIEGLQKELEEARAKTAFLRSTIQLLGQSIDEETMESFVQNSKEAGNASTSTSSDCSGVYLLSRDSSDSSSSFASQDHSD